METISLDELFDSHFINDCDEVHDAKVEILTFVKNICNKTLELAAENAKTKINTIYPLTPMPNGIYPISVESVIDKKSITDTINQIK